MTFLNIRHAFLLFGLTTMVALVPATASAKGSVHIDVPGFSIGFHDSHYSHGRHYNKHRRHYNKHRRHHYKHRYWHKRHDYYRHDYGYRDRPYRHRYDTYRYDRCPDPGYSRYNYRNRDCYRHKGHYHCEW
ncbi:MAG: hypothetical protein HKN50_02270 [Gammaproteobacteria bacterium]|nr:hypothetical protein [Gammaproteobacteria bacterium]